MAIAFGTIEDRNPKRGESQYIFPDRNDMTMTEDASRARVAFAEICNYVAMTRGREWNTLAVAGGGGRGSQRHL